MATHEELRVSAVAFARRQKYDYSTHETLGLGLTVIASETVTSAGDIPDVIGWKSGYSYMLECKASRSDFFADASKPQRQTGTGMGNFRYFYVPKGLVKAEELPADWGLIEVDGKKASVIVKTKLREIDANGHCNEKRLLLSLLRRIKMREFLIIQDEREPVPNA